MDIGHNSDAILDKVLQDLHILKEGLFSQSKFENKKKYFIFILNE